LKDLRQLKHLTTLDLSGCCREVFPPDRPKAPLIERPRNGRKPTFTGVTADGLKDLKEFKQLKVLRLNGIQMTESSVKELRDALPKCYIDR